MARFKDRTKAIKLRLQGKSYSQIKNILKANKSTLSYWLKDYPLSERRIRKLRDNNPKRIEKYRATRLRQKQERFNKIYQKEKKILLPFSKRDLFVAGLFLYWGEGTKTTEARISVSNTNPSVIKFFIKWLKLLKVPTKKIKIYLHLYSDMNSQKEINFWSDTLKIPKKQFQKPYVKRSKIKEITYRRSFSHGTCNVLVGGAELREKVMANLKIIEESF